MASSLSQQLAQVRSYNSAQLGNAKAASKAQSASYLFPPNVASTQDLHTLQALGANGWQELLQLDTVFSKWDQITSAGELLFGDASRSVDRLMKTKDENEELDRAISQFMQLVGGNLLDRSTGKCLEWLVRRFRVHEYNVEIVLSTFMPYHETQEFARMLQLLDLK
jgi:U3 small nucleolar RNA-associated protein 10